MPITLRLINDASLADKDFQTLTKGVQAFVPLVTKAWAGNANVVAGGAPVAGDWLIYISEKGRHVGAAGYHDVLNGFPVAYCSPKASGRLFGNYIKPLVIKGKTIHGALFTPGLITTICHEIAEMLCDPYIKTISSTDAQGRRWLVEVGDHAFGSFQAITVDGQNLVLPDITTPAFYDLKGKAPFSIFGGCTAPFTMTPKGYAYYMDANGKLIKI